jgi:hypothetical protein
MRWAGGPRHDDGPGTAYARGAIKKLRVLLRPALCGFLTPVNYYASSLSRPVAKLSPSCGFSVTQPEARRPRVRANSRCQWKRNCWRRACH